MGELEREHRSLSAFLESKIQVSITVKKRVLILDSKEKEVLPKEVKILVKRFLHREGLSRTYRVTEEHGAVRIIKREHKEGKAKEKGTPTSPYDTLPYFFPAHP